MITASLKPEDVLILSGTASRELAERICKRAGLTLAEADIGRFPNGEVRVEILQSARGKHAFIIQSTCPPVDENIMELLLIMDALRRASVESITVIMPYFGYSKQDKKKSGREPISAKLVADMIERAGADRLVTVDLHATQIEGFFDIPVDNLTPVKLFAEYFSSKKLGEVAIVSPDAGGAKRARDLANAMKARRIAIIDKYRKDYSKADAMNVVGMVEGQDCIIVDDFIDTGGTMVEAVEALHRHKAKSVRIAVTHALLTPPAKERFENLSIEEIVVTDSVPIPPERAFGRITILSVADMLADTIRRMLGRESLQHYRSNR